MSGSNKAAVTLIGACAAWITAGWLSFVYERAVVVRLAEAFTRSEVKDHNAWGS